MCKKYYLCVVKIISQKSFHSPEIENVILVAEPVVNSKVPSVTSGTKTSVTTVPSTQAAPLPPPTRTTAPLTVPGSTNTPTTLSASPATSPPNLRHSSYSSSNDTHHHTSHTRSAAENLKTTNRTPDPVVSSHTSKVFIFIYLYLTVKRYQFKIMSSIHFVCNYDFY